MSSLTFLEDRWEEAAASRLDAPGLLRYRSNLLGSDLRITNFAGGNTSSKIEQTDPLDGEKKQVLWVKGSGGDLGSIQREGFATLYLDKLLALERRYRGVEFEDEIADMYPLCTFGDNPVAASIDTSLHAFLPFAHIDHLHPDWGIALAASANGKAKMEEFNREFRHKLAWLPWQRPGFELALMLRRAVQETPGCDGLVLGGHGLFTWGNTQRESYLNTITIIDQLGQLIARHEAVKGRVHFGGAKVTSREDRRQIAARIFPVLRGAVSRKQRWIGSFSDLPVVLDFVNSAQAADLAYLGTSCPDHFIRTKIRPMFLKWEPAGDPGELDGLIEPSLEIYRAEYRQYYASHALPDSPAIRDANPTVVLLPGVGMFSFGRNKTESRVTGEFYVNAIQVMQGAGALGAGLDGAGIPQAGAAAAASEFKTHANYVALPAGEAFRIEYWKLEDAKLRRRPPEKELGRRIALVAGGGSGIGREAALLAAERGAHVVVADRDVEGAEAVAEEIKGIAGKEVAAWTGIDLRDRNAVRAALEAAIRQFGGIDILINTATILAATSDSSISSIPETARTETWAPNVTANRILAEEAAAVFARQGIGGSVVLAGPADAVVAEKGREMSQPALCHLVQELAVSLAPKVRVNGIRPAAAAKGSTRECAQAIIFLAGPQAQYITGHLLPVDGDPRA